MEAKSSLHDLEGSISLRAEETESGFRFFFDDDEESYFDLNLESMADSEDFQFQLSFPQLPDAAGAGLPGQQVSSHDQLQVALKYGDQQVYPAEMLLVPASAAPAEEAPAGGMRRKGQLDPASEKALRGSDSFLPKCMEQQGQGPAGTSKKNSKVAAKNMNNGVTKFLIVKLPSPERIRAALASIVKSYHHLLSLQHKRGHGEGRGLTQQRAGRSKYRTPLMHIFRWPAARTKRSSHVGKNSAAAAAAASQRPSDAELDEDFVRGILGAVDFTVGSPSRGTAVGRGRPSWAAAASSPGETSRKGVAGAVERHSSVSSAIAHCKMSYGDAPGFS